jgi:hypothetical protein
VREEALTYEVTQADGSQETYSLITRPWTLTQAKAMLDAAELLVKHDIPKGKWHQLLAGLKDGEPMASHHFEWWLQHLSKDQSKVIDGEDGVADILEHAGLWNSQTRPWVTRPGVDARKVSPLLELHQLREMLSSGDGGEEPDNQ